MKRQRSYGDGLDEDRRRFYERGPPPPPPPRRRPTEYDGDGFDRRKGFGSGFYDHRYRDSPSPRGYGGGDRALHRSESFSGFRRDFPKGFRSERDRSRRDGGGSSAWRRPGGGWRDGEGLDGHRAVVRRPAPSPPPPPQRSPVNQSRRLEGGKVEKARKNSCGGSEMEEGEVVPDPEPKGKPVASEPPETVNSESAKKGLEQSEAEAADSHEKGNLETEGKGENVASVAEDSSGKEGGKSRDGVMEEAGNVVGTPHEESALEVTEKVEGGEEGQVRDETANVVDVVGQSNSSGMLQEQEMTQEEAAIQDETANAVDVLGRSDPPGTLQEEVNVRDETANAVDLVGQSNSSGILQEVITQVEAANTVDTVVQRNSSGKPQEVMTRDETVNTVSVIGQSNSSGMLQEEMEEEVTTSVSQWNPQMKGTVTDEKDDALTKSIASQAIKEGQEMDHCEENGAPDKTKVLGGEEAATVEHDAGKSQIKEFDLEVKLESPNVFLQPAEEHVGENKEDGSTLNLISRKLCTGNKGKGIAFEVLSKEDNMEQDSSGSGSLAGGGGFDLALQSAVGEAKASKFAGSSSVKQEDDTLRLGRLDLSLSLSGSLQNFDLKCSVPKPDSRAQATSCQSLPSSSSLRTNSDMFTASISMNNSQTFVHNPSCSLTQQSLDNYEHSVGSKPLFQGIAQASNNTVWQAQLSEESKQNQGATPLLHRILQNGHASHNTLIGVNGQHDGMSNDLQNGAGTPSLLPPTHSDGSHGSRLERSRHRRQLTRERSSNSLLRSERQESEQFVLNGAGVIERVISKIVSEPLHLTGRMLQEMTDNSITYLREAICELVADSDKSGQIIALQEALHKRSDLNKEMLQRCPQVLLEILVAIRTGLPDSIKKSSSMATTDLLDIFLNLKCRNLSCLSMLPVDGCDCNICQRKTGFCSSCMCTVCSKFDMAYNTCSWVGCDGCLHWCHTDCALHHSLILKRGSGSRAYGNNGMQFCCAACGHQSEMFGFVKEVFRTCAKEWNMERLVRELRYVQRIFSSSDDLKGKRLRDFVNQMLIKLQNKAYYPEVVKYVMAFFSDDDSNLDIGSSVPLKGIPCNIAEGTIGIPSSSRKTTWLPSVTLEGVPFLEIVSGLSATESPSMLRKIGEDESQIVDKKPVVDELDSLVRLKQAEATMYQERANDAYKEAENLKKIAIAKSARIEEHHATQIAELHIEELQELRKKKTEELQVIEKAHHQFLSMKTRMEANIRELLLKMEATKQNSST